jgi:uracil-DNA glycosylase
MQPRLVIGVDRYAKAAVRSLYEAEARELNWPFRVPRPRLSDSPDMTYLLFPQHPYWIMTRPAPVRDQYVRRLARAIEWGFSTEAMDDRSR